MRILIFFFVIIFNFRALSLDLTITQGSVKPTPIAITDFFATNENSKNIGKNISNIISDNLERSGLFLPIDKNAFIQSSESLLKEPRFEDWKVIKSQHLVSGKITKIQNKISVEFRLYDVFSQRELIAKKYETSDKNWRRVSHIISDAVFDRFSLFEASK